MFEPVVYRSLLHDAAAIVLISFASGMLTAKSFARRNHYEIDANQELIAFGASNLASGLAQGFPVTGADFADRGQLRGRRQEPAGQHRRGRDDALRPALPQGAACARADRRPRRRSSSSRRSALFDVTGLRALARMSWREGLLSLGTTLGVLVLGVLPGVMLASRCRSPGC